MNILKVVVSMNEGVQVDFVVYRVEVVPGQPREPLSLAAEFMQIAQGFGEEEGYPYLGDYRKYLEGGVEKFEARLFKSFEDYQLEVIGSANVYEISEWLEQSARLPKVADVMRAFDPLSQAAIERLRDGKP
jgi:hypothetical protein